MKECIEKMKKEYTAPQMEVMDCAVQSILCSSDDDIPGGDIIKDD